MAKRTSSFRRLGIRNLKSSGNSAAKFTVGAASKATVGVFRYMATDHLGMADSVSRMPKMGAFDSLKYVLWMFLIRVDGALPKSAAGSLIGAVGASGAPYDRLLWDEQRKFKGEATTDCLGRLEDCRQNVVTGRFGSIEAANMAIVEGSSAAEKYFSSAARKCGLAPGTLLNSVRHE